MYNIDEIIKLVLLETIKKKKNKYCLISSSGKNLGCYKTKSGVKKREKQVNYFKSKKNEESAVSSIAGYSAPLGKKREDNE